MAAELRPPHRWKTYELDSLPEVFELRYEIVDGELIVSRRPNWKHQHTIFTLGNVFFAAVRKLGGYVFPEPGIVWEKTDEDNVIPDLAIVLPDRLELLGGNSTLSGAPNLVVEVVSKSGVQTDYVKKRQLYQRTGVQEYWIVDPLKKEVEVWRFVQGKGRSETFGDGETITTALVPGVSVVVSELWS